MSDLQVADIQRGIEYTYVGPGRRHGDKCRFHYESRCVGRVWVLFVPDREEQSVKASQLEPVNQKQQYAPMIEQLSKKYKIKT